MGVQQNLICEIVIKVPNLEGKWVEGGLWQILGVNKQNNVGSSKMN